MLKKLQGIGFEIKEKFELNDWYFSKYSIIDAKKISYQELLKSSVLIREAVFKNGTNKTLCYKDKVLDNGGNVIGEEKIETNIDSIENAIKILEKTGSLNWCFLNNKSIVLKKGIMQFCLQIIDGLGVFIEYEESLVHRGLTSEAKYRVLVEELKLLNIKLGSDFSCKKPYMLLHK